MIAIGEFARLGRVSVRMLRHYDDIGLLRPAVVDPHTGYRWYSREQLGRLNRVIALKDLGLRLEQVREIVDDQLTGDELRGMFRLRQAELEGEIRGVALQLARVQARLRLIDSEDTMTDTTTVTTKTVAPMTVVGTTAVAASATQEDVGPVIRPMFPLVIQGLGAAGVTPVGTGVAYYTPASDHGEDALTVHVGFPVPGDHVDGLEAIEIPAAEVASLIYRGSMLGVDSAYQTLDSWVRDQGATPTGYAREIYLEVPDDMDEWVTEIQLEFAR